LNGSAHTKIGQIHFEPGVSDGARRNFSDETIIKKRGKAADEHAHIQNIK
jgi:hypothetical protein